MSSDQSKMIWHSNPEWYTINYEKDCYELTDKAPEEARISFEKWLKGKD